MLLLHFWGGLFSSNCSTIQRFSPSDPHGMIPLCHMETRTHLYTMTSVPVLKYTSTFSVGRAVILSSARRRISNRPQSNASSRLGTTHTGRLAKLVLQVSRKGMPFVKCVNEQQGHGPGRVRSRVSPYQYSDSSAVSECMRARLAARILHVCQTTTASLRWNRTRI